jgi:hypothetical protein
MKHKPKQFGFCIFGIYESFLGHMKDSKWISFDQQADDGSGRSVKDVLESAFWDTLWESLPPTMTKREYQEAIGRYGYREHQSILCPRSARKCRSCE